MSDQYKFKNKDEVENFVAQDERDREELFENAAKQVQEYELSGAQHMLAHAQNNARRLKEEALFKKLKFEELKSRLNKEQQRSQVLSSNASKIEIEAMRYEINQNLNEVKKWEAHANKYSKIIGLLNQESAVINSTSQRLLDDLTTKAIELTRKNIEIQRRQKALKFQNSVSLLENNGIRSDIQYEQNAILENQIKIKNEKARKRTEELTQVINILQNSKNEA